MTIEALRDALRSPNKVVANGFGILQELCSLLNEDDESEDVQELILRALEWRDEFGEFAEILDALARERGLFQYIKPEQLSFADRIAYEVHRPAGMMGEVVFHGPQAAVFWRLMEGESVVLSAPTSFGKSLIIDAVISSGKYNNILIVVPTIALIDETRRRLTNRLRKQYKVITHHGQLPGKKNVYIGTQERVLREDIPGNLDFFVIDEFYKLSPGRDDSDRCALLNQVFYRLAKSVRQFFLLGPNVHGISADCERRLQFHARHELFRTVVSELHYVDVSGGELPALVDLCRGLKESTIIFCSSPPSAQNVLIALLSAGLGRRSKMGSLAADWIGGEYHPDWHLVKGLKFGIGLHHGRVPRALAHLVVKLFNEGEVKFLVCTSTLIEGVNTKAKNIVVFDNKINNAKLDLFTFNNIRGRAGRMNQHFVGHVYLFHKEPAQELPVVDVPVYSQDDSAPESLLMQIDAEDLTPKSSERLRKYLDQSFLSYDVLRGNVGIDPDRQIAVAKEIASDLDKYHEQLCWRQFPKYSQLLTVCNLIWKFFDGARLGAGSARSDKQLACRINALKRTPTFREMIAREVARGRPPDVAVQSVLDFLRLWAEFHMPRFLRALSKIQQDVFERFDLEPGDYDLYASKVETLFLPPVMTAMDEYGLPIPLSRRLTDLFRQTSTLDEVLERIRILQLEKMALGRFELELLKDVQSNI